MSEYCNKCGETISEDIEKLYVSNPPVMKWDGEKWVEVVSAAETTDALADNWERNGFNSVANYIRKK